MITYIGNIIKKWLISLNISEEIAHEITDFTGLILVLILAWISFYIAKRIIIHIVHLLVKKSKTKWDDVLAEKNVFNRLAYLAPAIVIHLLTPLVIPKYEFAITVIEIVTKIYMIFTVLVVINSFLNALSHIYQNYEISKSKPIKGYIQAMKVVLYTIGGILIIASLLNKSPNALFVGLGTISAVLIIVFKDPLLGFVGGIQLSTNNMIRIGDWIAMHKYGADGNVIDISLTSVKVQNWDKTITTIPTYALITDYFQNWRGMEESGGRRIKRSINIDMDSVKFCTPEMLDKFYKFQYLSKYVANKEKEIEEFNKQHNIDDEYLVNGRRQTNLGIFRAYLKEYLHNNPKISDSMTFLVRQLQPTELGIPIEIYVFSKVQAWADYEDIQSDIFDHVLAIIPEFELRIFQSPSGKDFLNAFQSKPKINAK
ncbi:MAG: mechanosensitive ion channel [Bacteroidales bacterium]|nr:mechanosensitive ion channel [Bacteroidales bacterium]